MRVMSNGRVKRSESEWWAIIGRHEASGLSRTAFCQQEGISKASFDKWKRRLVDVGEAKTGSFIEMRAPSEAPVIPSSVHSGEFELTFPGGVVLRWKS